MIWLTGEKKLDVFRRIAQENPGMIFIAWFDETFEKLTAYFLESNLPIDTVYLSHKVQQRDLNEKAFAFVEHFPLLDKEQEVYKKLGLSEVTVHTALDEPLMKTFGSETISRLMKGLGAKEDESFQHALISSSIKNAQQKLKAKLLYEHTSRSQADWFKQNVVT